MSKSKAKSIIAWKLKIEVEWDNGETEELDFPEHLAEYVDEYLTEIEEERAEEETQ